MTVHADFKERRENRDHVATREIRATGETPDLMVHWDKWVYQDLQAPRVPG